MSGARFMKQTIQLYVGVGIGGMVGASARYLLSVILENDSVYSFPWATLLVNMSGAFLLTLLGFSPLIKDKLKPVLLTAINTGIIGAFTTFSTIQLDTIQLLERNIYIACLYLGITIVGGLTCSFLGIKAAPYLRLKKEVHS